jgi:hypothetical protein
MVGSDNGRAYALLRAAISCANTRDDGSASAYGDELFHAHRKSAARSVDDRAVETACDLFLPSVDPLSVDPAKPTQVRPRER